MAEPAGRRPAPLPYAATRPDPVARRLRRLARVNLVCGLIAPFTIPAGWAAMLTFFRYRARHLWLPTVADFRWAMTPEGGMAGWTALYTADGLLLVASAALVARRRCRATAVLLAFLACSAVPFGSVAAVWTVLVLLRPPVTATTYGGRAVDSSG